jgi:hypothetical protein
MGRSVPENRECEVLELAVQAVTEQGRGGLRLMRPDELERQLRQRLDALGPAPRAELLHVLILPDFERADRIGEFWGYPESRASPSS